MRLTTLTFFVCLLGCTKIVTAKEPKIQNPMRVLKFSNGTLLKVEFVAEPRARQKGLMFRENLPADRGMLFQFDRPEILSFWMKNTFIPLEIGFFDAKKKLVNTLVMKPQRRGPIAQQDLTRYPSEGLCLYALEVNPGWFDGHGIRKGMTFQIQN